MISEERKKFVTRTNRGGEICLDKTERAVGENNFFRHTYALRKYKWRNLIPEEELKRKMMDDVCGCSVSEKEGEESKYADSHKILVFNRPRRQEAEGKWKSRVIYAEFESSVFLGLMLTISWWWWWMYINFTTFSFSASFLWKTFSHFEYFKTERMSAIVHYCGGNLHEISSILCFEVLSEN